MWRRKVNMSDGGEQADVEDLGEDVQDMAKDCGVKDDAVRDMADEKN